MIETRPAQSSATPPETDEAVAVRVQRGDAKAFGILMTRYDEKLTRYARRFLQDSDEVKDLVQEVFIKTYTNIQSFDAGRRFSPWIYRIAHNEFVNALKKRSGRETVSLFEFDTLFPHITAKETADTRAQEHELKAELDRSLMKLNAKYREPLILYYFEEMDYKSIADILRIPTSTVGVRLRRGKEMLKKLVGPTLATS